MLVLIEGTSIIAKVVEGGWFTLPNGDRVSPAQDGWTDGTCRLATIRPADKIPKNKQIISTSVKLVKNMPTYVHVLEDIPPPPIPDRVTARQFKLQLLASDMLDDVEAWVAGQSRAVQIAYANSGTFARSEPMMQAGFAALGFTEQQGDAFFEAAAAL